ncbi:MAG TPA: hypothetical protein DC049_13060, partial [Spirochaetia bacterium]|nr:hypothetical protein [Spirochaetia bacterium]
MSIQNQKPDGHNFGTFTGVFLPSILTIFGAVMFLRTNYIVGQAGITNTLIILLIASSIVFATALSISAIATNTPVYGGGVYYMISRVLGPALGGSIGIVLFFAQGLSIPFNITGFTEAIVNDYPVLQAHYSAILIGTGVVLFIIAVTGADIAIKFQYLIFITLGLGIAVAFGGAAVNFSKNLFVVNSRPAESADLIRLFAIFFPAVTGMMAGVNMSGDLKNPAKAIPAGILYANLAALLIYGLEIVLSGSGFSRPELLQTPYNVFVSHALFGMKFLVTAGVCAATISTAMGLFLCAPRVLQALARDRIIKFLNPFGKGYGKHNEPRPAAVLTFLLTAGVLIWAGKNGLDKSGISSAMNVLAQSASMFFLFTYAMINIAAFVESFGGNPSFRPRFRFFHWGVSLYGAAACIIAAFLINMLTAAGAALLMLMVFFYV